MDYLQQTFTVQFQYKVYFTSHLFTSTNPVFRSFLLDNEQEGVVKKILFVVDKEVTRFHPMLKEQIVEYINTIPSYKLATIITISGGEEAKNNEEYFFKVINAVNRFGIDRHSLVVGIGGGSVLDMTGYASAIAHRGIKHVRIPTTVLSQNDSGVGVKNGVNYLGKKNFLGTFAPPVAVFNDFHFLTTLSERDWRSGIAEAVKVALIKDADFFCWLEENAAGMIAGDKDAMQYQIRRCAELHLQHIAKGDPFEIHSARPLDFGHWCAHKLEQLSDFTIRHGEAVAIGIALDCAYSYLTGRLDEVPLKRILNLLQELGFKLIHPLIEMDTTQHLLLQGLTDFQEHLGGRLSITLLNDIGEGEEVHEMNSDCIVAASHWLQDYCITAQRQTA
ncbi:3-dehydroquinate synthase [Flavisolibacter tropicus]|uniref:3-dehydroquinate synthase n=1 Tax=Flavisolibacter tropicus TaxID=1492898 RepID=A0A172TVS7_9BACT|nr:3-dehydroquinate synthase [Flavisolibacter tropicus]ANE50847.1 3-dehydroquinate synthase [Flavisolibacter tropicus]